MSICLLPKLATQNTNATTATATRSKLERLAVVVTASPVSGCATGWWSVTVFAMGLGYPIRQQGNGAAHVGGTQRILDRNRFVRPI